MPHRRHALTDATGALSALLLTLLLLVTAAVAHGPTHAAADEPPAPPVTRACTNDDGSTAAGGPGTVRCVWDARHQGRNGEGRSFVVRKGPESDRIYVYVPHWVAHRLQRDTGTTATD